MMLQRCVNQEVCQLKQPHNIQSLEGIRMVVVQPQSPATVDIFNYVSDFNAS